MKTIGVTTHQTPLGRLHLAAHDGVLIGVSWRDERRFLAGLRANIPDGVFKNDAQACESAKRWLDAYFAGERPEPSALAIQPHGTAFQLGVWRELARVPYATLITYGELARRVGCGSAQAVGQAVGANPLPIVVPCHRVIAAGRRLGGFSSGLDRKRGLLAIEGIGVKGDRVSAAGNKGARS